jgi:transposase
MLTIGGTTRVFLAVQPVDLRGSFDRLYGYVTEVLREDPRSGHWFCFVNKRHTRLKILVFDGTGLWVLNKRLCSGRFTWPKSEGPCLSLRNEAFGALVSGFEVTAKRNWYRDRVLS